MNLKGIPFETVWVPFSEVEAKAKEVGAEPTRVTVDGKPLYTIPWIIIESSDGSKRIISDSLKIARYFDDRDDPSKTLFPKDTAIMSAIFSRWVGSISLQIIRVFAPFLVDALEPSQRQHFIDSRARLFGKSYHEMVPDDPEAAWKTAEELLTDFAKVLDEATGEGSFRITPRPTFSEIEFVSLLRVFKAYGSGDPGGWPRMAQFNGGRWAKLLELPEYDDVESVHS